MSEIFAVLSGARQGTHLGPIMFIMFINNSHTKSNHSRIIYFPVDTKTYKEILSIDDVNLLLQDVHSFFLWCDENGLECNA